MRESLTIVSAILILCLSVALGAPYFIDWNAQRGLIETHLSRALGEKVSIHGNIDLKLLPTPYLHLQNIEILDEPMAAHFQADDVFLEIAIPPLLRGEVDFIEARLQRPHLKMTLADDGTLQAPRPTDFSGQARFERIAIEDGKIDISDPKQSRNLILDHLDLNAEANSLAGPFKGDGNGVIAGEKTAFRFSTGAREGDNLRLKVIADQSKTHPRADFDGTLTLAQRKDGHVATSFAGTVAFAGVWHGSANTQTASVPWRLSGPLRIAANKAAMDPIDFRLGDEDHTINSAGTAELDFSAAAKATLSLHARQIDLDRLFASDDDTTRTETIERSLAGLIDRLGLSMTPVPVTVDATAETATLNGETLSELSGTLGLAANQPIALRFDGKLPGRSHLRLDGRLEPGSAKQFNGKVDASIADFDRLAGWLAGVLPHEADYLRKLPFHTLDASGEAGLSQVGFSVRDLTLRLDRSTLLGNLSYTRAVGSDPARLFVDVTSPTLDVDSWPDLQNLAQSAQATDLSIRFSAHTVKLTGLRKGAIGSGEIRVKLTKAGANTKLEELSLTGIGGATIAANGLWNGQNGSLEAKLNVPKLADIMDLARHLGSNNSLEFLSERASLLSPLQLDVHAEAANPQQASSQIVWPELTSLTLKGVAGGTSLQASIEPDAKTPASGLFTAAIDAPDTSALLGQLGARVLPVKGLGRGHIEIKRQGPLTGINDTHVQASLAGLNLDFQGPIEAPSSSTGLSAHGHFKLEGRDLSPFLQASGLAFADQTTKVPADLSGDLNWRAAQLDVRGLEGSFAGTNLSGFLSYALQDEAKKLTGTLDLDRLSAAALLELGLGAPQPAKGGFLWSNLSFNTGLPDPPSSELTLHAKSLDILPGLSGEDAAMQLAISPGAFSFQDVTMKTGGGTAAGTFTLRRDGPTAAVSAHLDIENYGLNLASLQGRASSAFDLSGSGANALALISSLAGSGHATLSEVTLKHTDPGALARIFTDVEHDKIGVDETEIERAFARELDRGTLNAETQAFDLAIASGALRLTSAAKPDTDRGAVSIDDLSLSLDLRNAALNQKTQLALNQLPKDWQGPPPRVALNFKGPLSNPTRTIDAVGFVNTLASRAIAREAARIQSYEFDVHERAVFNQRLQLDRKREAEQAKAEEDARRAAEAARRAEEAAKLEKLRKAEEARKEEIRRKLEEPLPLTPQSLPAANPKASNALPAVPADPLTIGRH